MSRVTMRGGDHNGEHFDAPEQDLTEGEVIGTPYGQATLAKYGTDWVAAQPTMSVDKQP